MLSAVLFWAVVALLVLVTGGISYLTFLSWRDSERARKR